MTAHRWHRTDKIRISQHHHCWCRLCRRHGYRWHRTNKIRISLKHHGWCWRCRNLVRGFLYRTRRRGTHLKRLQDLDCASQHFCRCSGRGCRSDIIVAGGGRHHGLMVRRGNVMGCQQQFQQTGSITRFTLTCLGVIRQHIGKRHLPVTRRRCRCQFCHEHGGRRKQRFGLTGLRLCLGAGPAVASSCCGVCIIANRLANNARVSASAPRFNPGVSPFGERFGPAPSASIVFISMPHSLVTTGAGLSAKREIPAGTLQKGCQNYPLFKVQRRRRGGMEASKRASRASWRAWSSASLRSTARECWCRALAASRRWLATSSERNSARLEMVFSCS